MTGVEIWMWVGICSSRRPVFRGRLWRPGQAHRGRGLATQRDRRPGCDAAGARGRVEGRRSGRTDGARGRCPLDPDHDGCGVAACLRLGGAAALAPGGGTAGASGQDPARGLSGHRHRTGGRSGQLRAGRDDLPDDQRPALEGHRRATGGPKGSSSTAPACCTPGTCAAGQAHRRRDRPRRHPGPGGSAPRNAAGRVSGTTTTAPRPWPGATPTN